MTEQDLLVDCLKRLNGCGVPYYLTGSMASNYWGVPRSTHDLDFVVQLRAAAVLQLVAAFSGEFFIQEASVRGGLQPPYQFNALDHRSSLKVDFWVMTDDPFAKEMFARRQLVSLFGTPAWIGSAEDVLLHKLVWNKLTPSDRQLLDAAGIWSLQGQQLDDAYLKKWAQFLGIDDVLAQIQNGKITPKNS